MSGIGRDRTHSVTLPGQERGIAALEKEIESLRHVVAERDQLLRMQQLALNNIREAAYLVDERGRFIYANGEASRALEYGVDELTSMSVMDIDPDWNGAKWSDGWAELREKGVLHVDTEHRRKDGSSFPVEIDCHYFEFDGRQYNLSLARDVSERKRSQRALLESEERYRQIFDNASDALYLIELAGGGRFRLIEVNPACEHLFGKTRGELLGGFFDDVLPSGVSGIFCDRYRHCILSPYRCDEELTLHFPRGQLHCHSTLIPVENDKGEVHRIVGIVRDLTMERQTQSLLISQRELDARFHRLAESSPEVICRHDLQCRFVYANSAFDMVLRGPRQAAIGRTPAEISDDANMLRYQAVVQAALDTGTSQDLEVILSDTSSAPRYHHVRIFPEFGPHGEVIGALAFGLDITARKLAEARLYASEQAFRAVVERSPDYIERYDLAYRRIYANPALLALVEVPENEVLGMTPEERAFLLNVPRYMDLLRKVVETGTQANEEMLIGDSPKRARWGHMRVVPEFGTDGKVASVLAICRDIDELKRSEELFRALAENFPDLVCQFDSESRFIYANPAATRALGVGLEELSGKRPSDLAPLSDAGTAALLESGVERVFAESEPNDHEMTLTTKKGGGVFEVRHVPEKDGNGRVFSVLSVARDVTKLRATERALRESEFAFRRLAENAPDPIIQYNVDGQCTYVNPEFERVARLSAEEPLGKPGDRFDAKEVSERLKASLRDVIFGGAAAKFELSWHDGNKEQCWYVHAVPEFDADGTIQSVLTVWRDIAERKEAEQRLHESYELLRELTSRRETAREEERKRIAREMHDELGQQLTALRMGVSTLRLTFARDNPALADQLQKMLSLTDNTFQVVRNVIKALRPMAIDAGIVAGLEWLASDFSRDGGIVCHLRVHEEDIALDDDRAIALFRIVQEALTNVTRHASAHGVFIDLQKISDDYVLEIRDDGRGFDPGVTRRNSFGLTGMKERVLMLGGEIAISSRPGCGASIKVRVPVRPLATEASRSSSGTL
ncbi:PAS domain-containing protein [Paraburkholderia mimosarum]|uniref:PAS domain-containing sensor histidine kinase n=1 Tax=Paraburkholderia mimosarum TaxID=312026 RepID=UPI0039C11353